MDISVGGIPMKRLGEETPRFSALVWGPAGCGKTTLAGTAPGKILWVNFDPDGPESLKAFPDYRERFYVLDLSDQKSTIVEKFKTDDAFGLAKILADDSLGIETVVVDSLTAYAQIALESAIGKEKGSTLEKPGWGAYGARNAFTLRLIQMFLRNTAKYNKNIIFITHEDAPVTNDEGLVLYITMQLGGKLPDQAALQISEVWFMSDDGRDRKIAIRPCRSRKPMKTRMFDASTGIEFKWEFNPKTMNPKFMIETWYQDWKSSGEKISVPK